MNEIVENQQIESVGRVRQKNQAIILAAAQDEFLTFGFKGASMKRIAERANLPRANIHYYYKNKLDLYGKVLNDIVSFWNSTVSTISVDDNPKETLAAYIRAKVMSSKTNPDASRIFASEIIHGAPHLTEYLATDFRRSINQKTRVIQSWIDQGKMDPIDPMHLLFFIWGATQHYADFGTQVQAAMDKPRLDDQDFDHIAETLIQLVLKGCGLR